MARSPTRPLVLWLEVALVDDGDCNVPIQSSTGRVVEPAKERAKP